MKNLFPLLISFILSVVQTNAQDTILVPIDYQTIQSAIDVANNDDVILVAPGIYVENINFGGKAIVVVSQYGPDSTVIDGNQEGSVVTFANGETFDSVIEGFTITNGSGTFFDPYWEYGGGGIYCNSSAPTIRYNVITGNTANNGGGIGAVYNAPIVITHNSIFGNSANVTPGKIGGGGGIAVAYDSDAEISHNNIFNNYSGKAGGGIAIGFNCDPNVINNTIRDNVASDYAGGIQIYSYTAGTFENNIISGNTSLGSNGAGGISCRLGSYSVINNNIIFDNSTATYGGGIRCFNDATPTIINNIIIGNRAAISGGGIECDIGAFANIMNTVLWNNEASVGTEMWIGARDGSSAVLTISYSDIKGGLASVYVDTGSTLNWGAGMIENNPMFRNQNAEDFHLMAIECGDSTDSPCIDAGNPLVIDKILDCFWGLSSERSDMGAYGGGDSVLVGVKNNIDVIPKEHSLSQNFPNPFNPSTSIKYNIPERVFVEIGIYDILGRKIETLVNEEKPAGIYEITWYAESLPSGVYFYQLKAGGFIETKKMLLMK